MGADIKLGNLRLPGVFVISDEGWTAFLGLRRDYGAITFGENAVTFGSDLSNAPGWLS
jgi:hypothetical protein